jgi:hypothetical protein
MANDYERSFMDQMQRYRASGGDLDTLVFVRSRYPLGIVIIEDDRNGSTRLFHATSSGWRSSVEWLLEQGADVHRCSAAEHLRGMTPLHAAVEQGQHGAAFLLLDAGARVNDSDIYGRTALHLAASEGSTKTCKLLLSRGTSIDARDSYGRDPEARARVRNTLTANFLAEVRTAGGWAGYVAAPRRQLLVLRRALPALRERGRASPSSVLVHERLFLRADVPDDVFSLVFEFWRSDRDYDGGSFDVDYHCHTHYDSGDDHRDKSRWIVRV